MQTDWKLYKRQSKNSKKHPLFKVGEKNKLAKKHFAFSSGGLKKFMKAIKCFICSIISCDFDKSGKKALDQRLSCTASDNLWARVDR